MLNFGTNRFYDIEATRGENVRFSQKRVPESQAVSIVTRLAANGWTVTDKEVAADENSPCALP